MTAAAAAREYCTINEFALYLYQVWHLPSLHHSHKRHMTLMARGGLYSHVNIAFKWRIRGGQDNRVCCADNMMLDAYSFLEIMLCLCAMIFFMIKKIICKPLWLPTVSSMNTIRSTACKAAYFHVNQPFILFSLRTNTLGKKLIKR